MFHHLLLKMYEYVSVLMQMDEKTLVGLTHLVDSYVSGVSIGNYLNDYCSAPDFEETVHIVFGPSVLPCVRSAKKFVSVSQICDKYAAGVIRVRQTHFVFISKNCNSI